MVGGKFIAPEMGSRHRGDGGGVRVRHRRGRADGTFVAAASRVDIAYDDARDILYISNGGDVLRYQVGSASFLSPIALGGQLAGMDISPNGNTLAVADGTTDATHNWIHLVNLNTLRDRKLKFDLQFGEGGTFTVGYTRNRKLLISSQFEGSGLVPLRRYDPGTGNVVTIRMVDQDTMLAPNPGRRTIGIAESNASNGPFGHYEWDGTIDLDGSTGWFNFEIGVDRKGKYMAIPTYGGTFIAAPDLHLTGTVIGDYAGAQPIAAVFHPTQNLVYFPFAETSFVKVYETKHWTEVGDYDFETIFDHTGNHAFVEGRAKLSADGSLLFVTVPGGVRFVNTTTTALRRPR